MKKTVLVLVLVAAVLSLAGCRKESVESTEGLTVAVSIVPEQAFVDAVAGDLVKVVCLIPPGASPESYEMEPLQRAEFENADVYFSIGVPAEAGSLMKNVSEKTRVVALDAALVDAGLPDLMLGGERDPHVWLSPSRAVVMVQTIARVLGEMDSANAAVYEKNAEAYVKQIEAAKAEIVQVLSGLEQRSFVVFHPAFGYFADEFGLEMVALEEDGKEATLQHLAEMTDFAKAEGIKAVFYQAEVDSRQAQAFADGVGGATVQLEPLAYDYVGNLEKMARTFSEVL